MEDPKKMARRHSAGAAIRHPSPFDDLESYQNEVDLTEIFIKKWATPYYMEIGRENTDWIELLKKAKSEITKDISLSLLGDFNWRTRLVGSYFAAVKNYSDLIDIIGTHLLKSEVCCVGHIYALTLALFNNDKSVWYLNTYLDYYLTKPDLYFDQEHVIEALLYLDQLNGSNHIERHISNWKSFLKARGKEDRKLSSEYFKYQISILQTLRQYSG